MSEPSTQIHSDEAMRLSGTILRDTVPTNKHSHQNNTFGELSGNTLPSKSAYDEIVQLITLDTNTIS